MKASLCFTIISALLMCHSCSYTSPADFWTRYKNDLIVFNTSDQGPWGGSRVIHWSSPKAAAFSVISIRAFAEKHGWKYVETISVSFC